MVYPSVDNAEEGDVYIGSTTQSLAKRMMSHRSHHKKVITSAVLLYLRNMVQVILKQNLFMSSLVIAKKYLNMEEGRYIRERKCVNKSIAGRTKKKYREDNRDK